MRDKRRGRGWRRRTEHRHYTARGLEELVGIDATIDRDVGERLPIKSAHFHGGTEDRGVERMGTYL